MAASVSGIINTLIQAWSRVSSNSVNDKYLLVVSCMYT